MLLFSINQNIHMLRLAFTDFLSFPQELPYHLEQLVDNNRLIRCLLEWPVFNRLFSEDFSIDLLHSWRKAGGYSVASALYKESCKVFKSTTGSLHDYGEQLEKVITFL